MHTDTPSPSCPAEAQDKDLSSTDRSIAGGYLRLGSILAPGVFPVSRTTWYKLIAKGLAPAPVKIGSASFWRAADIEEFLARAPHELTGALALVASDRSKS